MSRKKRSTVTAAEQANGNGGAPDLKVVEHGAATTEEVAPKEPKPRRGKAQPEFPLKGEGVEKASVPEIDDASDELVALRERKKKITEDVKVAEDAVRKLMKKHKLNIYSYADKRVEVEAKDDAVKVKDVDAAVEDVVV